MRPTNLPELCEEPAPATAEYTEVLRIPAMSAGLYRVPAGGDDPQQPHAEDEIYYVLAGCADMTIGDATRPVVSGDVICVRKQTPHRFCNVREELQLLVVFAPAETSTNGTNGTGPSGNARS